jgi:Holliday junction resolvase-like predicted endonuclease
MLPDRRHPLPGSRREIFTMQFENQKSVGRGLFEGNLSSERDWEEYLVNNLDQLEQGLGFLGRQVETDVGRIDILAKDSSGNFVVIELKVGEADDSAVGQVSRYAGWYAKNKTPRQVRAILVASAFSEGAKYAASLVSQLTLLQAKITFTFESVTLG